ncbi:IPT/TIG domain-containing protein [Herbiconiux sp. 11R-BC]|uniref:IPT/TIG domain-containing protein n=1 Tax=Herbiconiux sp. 11R-BC TaxID=3111637 RepID=UPI003C00653A
MSIIQLTPLILKDAVLQIGADQYEKAISNVTFTPSANAITWSGVSGTFTDTSVATWTASISFVQDWDTAGSLSAYLFNNEGATVAAVFRPRNGTGPSFSVNLIITPGAIGGAGNATAEATVTLGITGKPVLVAGTPVIPTVSAATPATGGIAGGTLVKITGSKFIGAVSVQFGTTNATSFFVESDSVIYATSPAQAAGSKPVKVTNGTGQSTTTAAYSYA